MLSVLCGGMLALAGCGGGGRGRGGGTRQVRLPAAEAYRLLAATGARFDRVSSAGRGSCVIPAPVRLRSLPIATMSSPVLTSANLAVALARFEVQAIQPLAVKWLGAQVRTIGHYGSYACRSMTGNGRRLSLHATGEAIDLASFTLTDGRVIRVKEAWEDGTRAERRFVQDLAAYACRYFSVVLTPHSDSDHLDHLHLDIGPWTLCSL
ncbi:extensin family protein [Marinivivus vitaminiproducens]|uniref:extensin family protein n=1 Tax=Marinivivus vitaminiproducens TaxID=3035935 RepID=UPI002799146D|nr:extensin family protein [Geminicoccaceae bacterium SCSIO 64248]